MSDVTFYTGLALGIVAALAVISALAREVLVPEDERRTRNRWWTS